MKKILLLYITEFSGHHKAGMAIEKAIKLIDHSAEVMSVNSFHYTNPILEKIINKTYMSIIKSTPEVWEYLYDNPGLVKNTQRLKGIIHKYNSKKMKNLLDSFKPDVIVTTQAFPCGIVADIKKTYNINTPLVAVLTDFYPHSYWIYNVVDRYIVASDEAKSRLVNEGIPAEKVQDLGIPIDVKFIEKKPSDLIKQKLGLDLNKKTILLMGGGQGLGPIKPLVFGIEKLDIPLQAIVITGTNKRLYKYLKTKSAHFRKKMLICNYSNDIDEFMEAADIIVTKPGGITTSEALAKSLPILIVNPIPGQEEKNARFLIKKGAAIKAESQMDFMALLEHLHSIPLKLQVMSESAMKISKPYSALHAATTILNM